PLMGASGTAGKPGVIAELLERSASTVAVEISTMLTRSAFISSDGRILTSYNTAAPLGNINRVSSRTFEPDALGKNTVPDVTWAVQSTKVTSAGTTSCIRTCSAYAGPLFRTVIT